MGMSYSRFAAMIATSMLVMFGLMYVHTFVWDHVEFSETRAWMTVLMGAMMAIVMLGFMRNMYKNRRVNAAIFVGAALTLVVSAWFIRSQTGVDDVDYMEAMIPHHSIAILTSSRAEIRDPRVRALADKIIRDQREEVAEMQALIRSIRENGVQR